MNVADLRNTLIPALGENLPAPEPEIRFRCPKCIIRKRKADTSGHLHVNALKEKFVCFRCGWKGPLSALLQTLNLQVGVSVRDWAEIARGMSLFRAKPAVVDDEAYDNTEEIGYPCQVIHPMGNPDAWSYLTAPKDAGGRGLTVDHINFYRLVVGTDKYASRIFIPTLHDGQVVFWVARSFANQEPKYLNPKDVSKKHYLFGLEQAKNYNWVIITEGVFSAIAAGPNAVATFGKAVSNEQRSMILDTGFQHVYVALDGDARAEAIELAKWFSSRNQSVFLVDMPMDQDPDSDILFHERIKQAKPYSFYSTASYGLCNSG